MFYVPLDAPLTQEEISTFEQINNIVIQDEHREFLTTIGSEIKIDVRKKEVWYIYGIKCPYEIFA